MKVFISSTFVDLIEYRQKAVEVLLRYKDTPIAMEYFGSQSEEPTRVCETEIQECDLFVGIYAYRYGFVPQGGETSITRREYELAQHLKKPCLCFIVKDDFPWNPKFIEMAKLPALTAFLDIVKKERVLDYFTTPEDFAGKLATSLANAVKKQSGTDIPGGKRHIPTAPFPYMAHPYPLSRNFTGREAEMAVLSNWFYNEAEPVLVLEAIGGMGKSAMSWVWLQKEILGKPVETEGVFWWSFYDEPFESFIAHLAPYVLGTAPQEGIDLTDLTAVLHHRRFLLVLDGLERVLRGYAGMEAMFIQEKRFAGDNEAEARWERQMREPVHPWAGHFFGALCASQTRTLITTRLMPVPLEGLDGVKRVCLTGLSRNDTVRFLRGQGVRGTRSEMEEAGGVYQYHPLMLTLLVSAITMSRTRDIQAAFSMNLINREEPHKILSTAFGLLSEEERRVAESVSVFRGVFIFDAVKALMTGMAEERLWQVLLGLSRLGFLFYDETADSFDFHPIMRSFLYGRLTRAAGTGETVHILAVAYFKALPKPEKVVRLEDLAPVIELYHHLVKAGKYDEARDLFRDRINQPTYYQLSAYHLIIELLKPLFPDENCDNGLPRLEKESDQAWTLAALGNTYALSGQPAKAVPLFLLQSKLYEKGDNKVAVAISLGAVASVAQAPIGQFSASTAHLRKSIALCREIKDEFQEAVGHLELGRVLAFQSKTKGAEEELAQSTAYWVKTNDYQGLSVDSVYRSLSALLQARFTGVSRVGVGKANRTASHGRKALEQARRALSFAEKTIETKYPHPRDFVKAYWLLGEALIQCGDTAMDSFEIPFYDEYFQEQTHAVTVKTSSVLTAAEGCLNEALRRCRKVNMVDMEPDILLGLARLDWANRRPPDETRLAEVLEIALRAGYRLVLADLHLFCGQVLLEKNAPTTLLNLTAAQHLQKAKEYALDVSEVSHLYQSTNPDFYKDIPEYEMLKRGMTDEERITNGYWPVYQMAEERGKE